MVCLGLTDMLMGDSDFLTSLILVDILRQLWSLMGNLLCWERGARDRGNVT